MIRYKEAQEIILTHAHSFGKEIISLDDAPGRVLSEKIFADRDYPPFNRSAMDGFALQYSDLQQGIRQFRLVETIYAGQQNSRTLSTGDCFKIMTGAAVPSQADMVIRKEQTGGNGQLIDICTEQFKSLQNIAKKGEDLLAGDLVIDKAMICTASVISLLASLGKVEITVEKLPRVAIITTGDEVMSVGSRISPVQIRNSNAALLKALLKKQPGISLGVQHVQDDPVQLRNALNAVMDADIIITSGGVSAGDADYVPMVLEQLGVQKLFHKVAIKPGKPLWCGKTANNGIVFALPGNPFSCLVTFTVFIQSYLSTCFGLPVSQAAGFYLDGERKKNNDLDEFFPVKFERGSSHLHMISFNGSGDIQAALHADGIAVHPFNKEIIKCEPVSYFPL